MGYSADIYVDVRFDFAGSLRLAAALWAYAEDLDALRASRRAQAGKALASWRGPYGHEFAGRENTDEDNLTRLANTLREDANAWAHAWAQAMNQQNWRLYARRCKEIEDSRNLADKFVDLITGIDLPPQPKPVAPPRAPAFAPTACLGG